LQRKDGSSLSADGLWRKLTVAGPGVIAGIISAPA
jgi:hypothetical protein